MIICCSLSHRECNRLIGAFVELDIFKRISRTNLGHYIRNFIYFPHYFLDTTKCVFATFDVCAQYCDILFVGWHKRRFCFLFIPAETANNQCELPWCKSFHALLSLHMVALSLSFISSKLLSGLLDIHRFISFMTDVGDQVIRALRELFKSLIQTRPSESSHLLFSSSFSSIFFSNTRLRRYIRMYTHDRIVSCAISSRQSVSLIPLVNVVESSTCHSVEMSP